jgi:hypothetical protein
VDTRVLNRPWATPLETLRGRKPIDPLRRLTGERKRVVPRTLKFFGVRKANIWQGRLLGGRTAPNWVTPGRSASNPFFRIYPLYIHHCFFINLLFRGFFRRTSGYPKSPVVNPGVNFSWLFPRISCFCVGSPEQAQIFRNFPVAIPGTLLNFSHGLPAANPGIQFLFSTDYQRLSLASRSNPTGTETIHQQCSGHLWYCPDESPYVVEPTLLTTDFPDVTTILVDNRRFSALVV